MWASQALRFQLEEVAQRHGLDRLVLADEGGNLWAASSVDESATALAAALPALYGRPDGQGVCGLERRAGRFALLKLKVGRATLFLGAQYSRARRALALKEAARGVQRILDGLATATAN